jgi:hypothetical protein
MIKVKYSAFSTIGTVRVKSGGCELRRKDIFELQK